MAVNTPAFFDTSILVLGIIDADEIPGPAHAIMDAIADGSPHANDGLALRAH